MRSYARKTKAVLTRLTSFREFVYARKTKAVLPGKLAREVSEAHFCSVKICKKRKEVLAICKSL